MSRGAPLSKPRYLVQGIFCHEWALDVFSGPAKIADWCESFLREDPPVQSAWCGPYITPEFNSQGQITMAVDVWCLGCHIFEIFTGYDLFGVKDDPPGKVLNAMMEVLGLPPGHLLHDWRAHVGETQSLKLVEEPRSLQKLLREAIFQSHKGEGI